MKLWMQVQRTDVACSDTTVGSCYIYTVGVGPGEVVDTGETVRYKFKFDGLRWKRAV